MKKTVIPAIAIAMVACAPQKEPPATVSSQGQLGGVTANSVGTVNQTLPPKIRSPYLVALQQFYVDGARIYRKWQTMPKTITDADIGKLTQDTNKWISGTYTWIAKNITPAAAERFQEWEPSAMSFMLPADQNHSADAQRSYKNSLILMPQFLANLDALMRSDEMYPQ